MAQWDVHRNPVVKARDEIPFLVVVQSDLLSRLPTRLVMPLSRSQVATHGLPLRMTPSFVVLGETVTLKPHEAGALPTRALGPVVANVREQWSMLVDALDAVISGI